MRLNPATKDYSPLAVNVWQTAGSKSGWQRKRAELVEGIASPDSDFDTPGSQCARACHDQARRCRAFRRRAHKLRQLPRLLLGRGAGPGADTLATCTDDPDANTKAEVFCFVAAPTGFYRQMKNQADEEPDGNEGGGVAAPQVVSNRNRGVNLHRKREVVGVNVRVGREDRDANRDLWINIDV